ncbi:IS66 family transposase ISCku7 [subsurface metagenome]
MSNRKNQMDSKIFERRKNKLFRRLDQFLETIYKDQDAKRLIKRLKRHKNELFTFLDFEGVSPYNNHAEQQLRKPVITRKISHQNRSEQGAKTQAILMSLFRSTELQGVNPIDTILAYAKYAIDPNFKLDDICKLAA